MKASMLLDDSNIYGQKAFLMLLIENEINIQKRIMFNQKYV